MGQTATPDQIQGIHKRITPTHRTNRVFACIILVLTLVTAHVPFVYNNKFILNRMKSIESKHASIVQLLWCGFVMAISLMEAWVKFRAQFSIRYIALDMGRLVFFALNKVEICFAGLWYLCTMLCSNGGGGGGVSGGSVTILDLVPIVILLVQVMVVQPVLDRLGIEIVEEAVHGKKPKTKTNPMIHLAYVLMELVKVGCLLVIAVHKL